MDTSSKMVTRFRNRKSLNSATPVASIDLTKDSQEASASSTRLRVSVEVARRSSDSLAFRSSSSRPPAKKLTDGKISIKTVPKDKSKDKREKNVQDKYKDKLQEKSHPSPECPVCLEPLINVQLKRINCGHIICVDCVNAILVQTLPKCPKCRGLLIKSLVLPVYF